MAIKNTDINNEEWKKRKTEAFKAAQTQQIERSKTFHNVTGVTRNGTDNSNKLGSKYYSPEKIKNKYLDKAKYSYTDKKDDELNVAEIIAKANREGSMASYQPILEKQILDPTSRFYNPYFGKRTVQNSKAEEFLRSYFGYDGEFDENFFEQTKNLAAYELRDGNTGLTIQSPGSKGTNEQWAAYYRVQLMNDMSKQKAVDEEWNELRGNMQTAYSDYVQVYDRVPSYEELMSYIDMSDYSNLKKIDDSRNLDYSTSAAPVELNKGTWYSREALAGVYNALVQGKDVREDRDYFGDAVQYYMRPVYDAPATKNRLESMGYSVSEWNDNDYATAMDEARKSGNHEVYEALSLARWANTPHMDGIDTSDYLSERFGVYKNDEYFTAIERVFAPIWEEMYTDPSKTSIKKPSANDRLIHRAAYQAWQDYQLKDVTDSVEKQADGVYAAIDEAAEFVDKSAFSTYEEYSEEIHKLIDPVIDASDLSKYMSGDIKTARTVFISNEEIEQKIADYWNGVASNVSEEPVSEEVVVSEESVTPTPAPLSTPAPEEDTVEIAEPVEVPFDIERVMGFNAANEAIKYRENAKLIAESVLAFSQSDANITAATLAENGVVVAPSTVLNNESAARALVALWDSYGADGIKESIGEGSTFEERTTVDPVLKALGLTVGIKDEVSATIGDVFELVTSTGQALMSGEGQSLTDGILNIALPGAFDFIKALDKKMSSSEVTFDIADRPFNAKAYSEAYHKGLDAGYSSEDASAIGLEAALIDNSVSDIVSSIPETSEAYKAVGDVFASVAAGDGYADSVEVVRSSFAGASGAATTPDEAALIQELEAAVLLGMSEEASPTHAAATKDLMSEILSGNISDQDIIDGLNNFKAFRKNENIDNAVNERLAEFALLGIDSTDMTIGTSKYDEAIKEGGDVAEYAKQFNPYITTVAGDTDIISNIFEAADKYGHADNYGTDLLKESQVVSGEDVMYLFATTGLANLAPDGKEAHLANSLLDTYANWFSYDENRVLRNAWSTGFITYDALREIINDRVSKFSTQYVSALKHSEEVADTAHDARDALDDVSSEIITETFSDPRVGNETAFAANSVLSAIENGEDYFSIIEDNDSLKTAIDFDTLSLAYPEGSELNEAVKHEVEKYLSSNDFSAVEEANAIWPTLNPTQVAEVRKAIDVYEQFGAYGYDFAVNADASTLKAFNVDFESVGLNENLAYYLDYLTDYSWRYPYEPEGMGIGSAADRGLAKGFRSVGNIPFHLLRFAQDTFAKIGLGSEYEAGQGDIIDNVLTISGAADRRLATKSTSFENFTATVIAEVVKNYATAQIGGHLGASYAAKHLDDPTFVTPDTVANVAGTAALQNPSKALRIADMSTAIGSGVDVTSLISRAPFAASVFGNTYSSNRDMGRNYWNSTIRGLVSTEIEIFTESPLIDDTLSRVAGWVTPGINNYSNAFVAFAKTQTRNAIVEIGQEEISLAFDRFFDFSEEINTDNISDVRSLFAELWRSTKVATEGMGAEAATTAASTFLITVIGGVGNLSSDSLSRQRLEEYQRYGFPADVAEIESFVEIAIMEMEEQYASGESAYDPKTQTPSFKRTPKEEEVRAMTIKYANGEISEEEFVRYLIAGSNTGGTYAPSVDNGSSVYNPQTTTPSFERNKPESTSANSGAEKVANYAAESEKGIAEAAGNHAAKSLKEKILANDSRIKSVARKRDVAQRKYANVQKEAESIAASIEQKNASLQGVFSAAISEGQDLNSPKVRDAAGNIQQSIASSQNELAEKEKVMAEIEEEIAVIDQESAEVTEEVSAEAEAEAEKVKETVTNDTAVALEGRHRGYEEENPNIVQGDELSYEEYREQVWDNEATREDIERPLVHNDEAEAEDDETEASEDVDNELDTRVVAEPDPSVSAIIPSDGNVDPSTVYSGEVFSPNPNQQKPSTSNRRKSVNDGELRDTEFNTEHAPVYTNTRDYFSDFEQGLTDLATAFRQLESVSEKVHYDYMVNISQKDYRKLMAAIYKMPEHSREHFKNLFLRKMLLSSKHEDLLPKVPSWRYSTDVAERSFKTFASEDDFSDSLSDLLDYNVSMHKYLSENIGLIPAYQSEDEIIFLVSRAHTGSYEKSPELISAETTLKTAQKTLSELQARDNLLRHSLSGLSLEEKKPVKDEINANSKKLNEARLAWREALANYERLAGEESNSTYLVFSNDKLQKLYELVTSAREHNTLTSDERFDAIIASAVNGEIDRDAIIESIIETYDLDIANEQTKNAVLAKLDAMSTLELVDELTLVQGDKRANEEIDSIIAAFEPDVFNKSSEVKAYVDKRKEEGSYYTNLKAENRYYAHAAFLHLWKQYEHMLTKNSGDFSPLDFKFANLKKFDFGEFMGRLSNLSNATASENSAVKKIKNVLDVSVAPFSGNEAYSAVDVNDSGVLRVLQAPNNPHALQYQPVSSNKPIIVNGDYSVDEAVGFIKDFCEKAETKGISPDESMSVILVENGRRVSREVGKYYRELKGVFAPTYNYLLRNAESIYYKRSSNDSSRSLDFCFSPSKSEGVDPVTLALDAIDREYVSKNGGERSKLSRDDFSKYARKGLARRRSELHAKVTKAISNFNEQGDSKGKNHQSMTFDDIEAMRAEIAAIKAVLRNDRAFNNYISGYAYSDATSTPASTESSVEDKASRDEIIRRNVNTLENDKVLTKNLSPESLVAFYASRADDARIAGNDWLYKHYNRHLLESAKRVGLYVTSNNEVYGLDDYIKNHPYETEETNSTTEGTTEEVVTTEETIEDTADVEVFANNDPELLDEIVDESIAAEEDSSVRELMESRRNEVIQEDSLGKENTETPGSATKQDVPLEEYFVDAATLVEGIGSSAKVNKSAFEEAEQMVSEQSSSLSSLQKEVESAQTQKRLNYKEAKAYIERSREIKKYTKQRERYKPGDSEFVRLTNIINGLYADQKRDVAGQEAMDRYVESSKAADALVERRNKFKTVLDRNFDALYANEALAGIISGRSFASSYGKVYAGKGKNPVEFARSVINSLKNKKWFYGNHTTFNSADLAEAISSNLDTVALKRNKNVAFRLYQHSNEIRKEIADLRYENAYLQFRLGNISSADLARARSETLEAYRGLATKNSASVADYKEYQSKVKDLMTEARESIDRIVAEHSSKDNNAMLERANKISNPEGGEITSLENTLEILRSSSRALFDVSSENILASIEGENGGRLPIPVVDMVLGIMLDVSEGKTTKDKAKIRKGIDGILNKNEATSKQKDIIAEYYAKHLTDKQLEEKVGNEEEYNSIKALISSVEEKRSALLKRFKNPQMIFDKIAETPSRILDFLFGDYAPIMKTLYYTPLVEGENAVSIERDKILDEFDAFKLNEEQNAYLHEAVDTGKGEEVIRSERPDDAEKIIEAGKFISKTFKDQLVRRNEVERRNGIALTAYRKNYTHHIRKDDTNGFFRFIGINNSDYIPTELLGKTEAFKPVRKFDSSTMERKGDETIYDMRASLATYLTGSLNSIHQMDNIIRTRQLVEAGAGQNREEVDPFSHFDRDQNGKFLGNRMAHVFEFFTRLADNAAGKKSSFDRGFEAKFGRKGYGYINAAKSARALSLIGLNIKSAATNIQPLIRVASMHPIHTFKAMIEMLDSVAEATRDEELLNDLSVVDESSRVKTRSFLSAEETAGFKKLAKVGMIPAEAVDRFATRVGTLALYKYETEVHGLSEADAIEQASDIMERLQGSKTKMTRPEIYNSAPWSLVLQFTQESLNDLMFTFKDLKHYGGGIGFRKAIAAALSGLFYYFLNRCYNDLFNTESLADPIGAVEKTVANINEGDNVLEIGKDIVVSAAESMNPYSNIFEEGLSGIPVVGGIADGVEAISGLFEGDSESFFINLGLAILGFSPYGTQAKRTVQGIVDVSRGYSTKENGNVKYLIRKNPANYLVGSILGTDSLSDAEEYYESGYSSLLGSTQSEVFTDLVESGSVEAVDAYKAIKGTSKAKTDTKAANAAVSDDAVSSADVVASINAANESREEAGFPSDIAPWAIDEKNSFAETGIDLWKKYGIEAYPKNLGNDDANNELITRCRIYFKAYNNGAFGETDPRKAAQKLANYIRGAETELRKKYSEEE